MIQILEAGYYSLTEGNITLLKREQRLQVVQVFKDYYLCDSLKGRVRVDKNQCKRI